MGKYQKYLEKYQKSGLSKSEFARKEGVSVSTVHYYLKRAKESETSDFYTLELKKSKSESVIRILTPSGLSIEIPY